LRHAGLGFSLTTVGRVAKRLQATWNGQNGEPDRHRILCRLLVRRCTMLDNWSIRFPNCEAIAHHLPIVFPDRWVRFHSLPNSKRYPENELEQAMVIDRHNCILSDLCPPEEMVVLLTTAWSNTAEPVRCQAVQDNWDAPALPWRTIAMHEQPDKFPKPTFWHIFVSTHQWCPGVFDPLVRLVAADVLANVMIASPDCRWLLHPYDGGMDALVESQAERDKLANSHSAWLASEWLDAGDARDIGLRLH
jgi:hypothetical protein